MCSQTHAVSLYHVHLQLTLCLRSDCLRTHYIPIGHIIAGACQVVSNFDNRLCTSLVILDCDIYNICQQNQHSSYLGYPRLVFYKSIQLKVKCSSSLSKYALLVISIARKFNCRTSFLRKFVSCLVFVRLSDNVGN